MILKLKAGNPFKWMAILLLFQGGLANAQDTLPEAMIYSYRASIHETYSVQGIQVIDQKEIQRMNIRSIDELLRYVPFMDVNSRGMFGAQSDLSLRGCGFNQVVVLVDGMRSGDPLTGHFASYLPVSIAEISRIEIIRGPAAAMYGADAIGGIIHIITRSNPEIQADTLASQVLKTTFGSYGFRGLEGGVNRAERGLNGAVWQQNGGMQWNQATGHPNSDTSNSGFNNITGSYALGFRAANNQYRSQLRFGWDARAFDARNFYTLSSADQSIEEVRRWMIQHKGLWILKSNKSIEVMANFIQGKDSFRFSPAAPSNVHQTRYANLQSTYSLVQKAHHSVLSGIAWERRSIESNDRGNRKDQRISAYMIGKSHFGSWMFHYSLRAEHDNNYKGQLIPQMATLYRKGSWNWRSMIGRGIRAADFTERYIHTALPNMLSPGRNVGNPGLKAERFWNAESGLAFRENNIKAEATLFYRMGMDLIDYSISSGEIIMPAVGSGIMLNPESPYLWAGNMRRLDVYGLELSSHWEKMFSQNHEISVLLAYAYNGLRYEGNDFSKYISNTTRHLFQGRVMYRKGRFEMQHQVLFKDRYFTPVPDIEIPFEARYLQWNLNLAAHIFKGSRLFLECNNLSNAFISDVYGAVLPGRWFLFGLHYSPGQ